MNWSSKRFAFLIIYNALIPVSSFRVCVCMCVCVCVCLCVLFIHVLLGVYWKKYFYHSTCPFSRC